MPAVALLCIIVFAFYHGLWLPGLVLIKRDAFTFYLPLKQYVVERLTNGELPQWFPYEGLGRPFIGVPHTGVFHPFALLSFLFSGPDAYRVSTLLTCLAAAFGAFVLGRTLGLSRAGALLAGIAFTLSGYVVSLTDNLLYLYSICLLPFFCVALEEALAKSRAWVVLPAALWATVFLIGDVQTGYYYFFIALIWTMARAPSSRLEACLRLTLISGLAAVLAGIQLGPAWAVFMGSERTRPELFHEQALHWTTHPLRLLTLLASPVGEHQSPVVMGRSFFGTPSGGLWAESLYLGVPVLGLACLGAWHRRDLRALALLGGFALLLALGQFGLLYEIFYQVVPLWSAFRYPEKFMGVVSFAVAMLSGAGLDAVRAGKSHPVTWLTAASLCVCIGLILFTRVAGWWVAGTFGVTEAFARSVTASAAQASLFSAAAALGMALVVAGLNMGGALRSRLLLACLIAIIPLDLSRANLGVYHTGPVEAATFTPPLAEALRTREGSPGPGRFRLVTISEDILVLPQDFMQSLGFYGASSVERRQALAFEHNAQFHLETVLPYLAGYSATFAETLNPKTGIEAAARLNAKYYIGRRYHLKDPRLAKGLVAELPPYDLALFENPVPAKPRAYLSQRPERATARVDPMALFMRPDFLNGDVDVIETTDVTLPGPARGGSAAIERYAPEDVRVHTETPQPAVLILLDAFDQGWTVILENGAELPILRANALVRAVAVPAGLHIVTFRYETPLLRAGAAASFAGMLLCLGLIVHGRWRGRAVDTSTEPEYEGHHVPLPLGCPGPALPPSATAHD
jgi:membrane protein YfhO